MNDYNLPTLECNKCKHRWIPRKANSCCCPKCQHCLLCNKTKPNCKCKVNK